MINTYTLNDFASCPEQIVEINLDQNKEIFDTIRELSTIDLNYESFLFDIRYTCGVYLKCDHYIILTCFINELRSQGKSIKVRFDTSLDCDTIKYASRINFFSLLGIDYNETFCRHDTSDSLIEITHLTDTMMSDELSTIFKKNYDLNEDDLEALLMVLNELISNIKLHSDSSNGGYIFSQKFKRHNRLDILITDAGLGINNTLIKAYPNLSNEESLLECLKYEITCGNGRGHGLYIVSEVLKENKGKMRLISGANNLHILKDGKMNITNNAHWQGTIIKLSFNLNNPLSVKNIFKRIGYS